MDGILTLPLSGYWWDDSLILPQSGSPLPIVEEELVGELTGRWDYKDGVPPLNPPIEILGDGGMSPTPLPPPHMVSTPQTC